MMCMSDVLTQYILKMMEDSGGTAEIQRNVLAGTVGCAPSQINYVLTSRFTPEQGFLVESRRGGGGYIRVTRIKMSRGPALMHTLHSVGSSIDAMSARALVGNLAALGYINKETAAAMRASVSDKAYSTIEPARRDELRAAVFKNMLAALLHEKAE